MIRYNLKKFWMMKESGDGVWVTHADHEQELGYVEERVSSAKKDNATLWDHVTRQHKKIEYLRALVRSDNKFIARQWVAINHLETRLLASTYVALLGWGVVVIALILFSVGVL